MSSDPYDALRQFIIGCFHQDWLLEAATAEAAVRQAASREPTRYLRAVLQNLSALLHAGTSEVGLRQLIIEQWGASLNLTGTDTTYFRLLSDVRSSLAAELKRREAGEIVS